MYMLYICIYVTYILVYTYLSIHKCMIHTHTHLALSGKWHHKELKCPSMSYSN